MCEWKGSSKSGGILLARLIGNKKSETQSYITTALKNGGKHIYFAPYIHE